jgi:hypothetical protein
MGDIMRSLAGTGFFISSSSPATNDVAGFNAIPYIPVNGVESISEISEKHETYTQNLIGTHLSLTKKTGKISFAPVTINIFRMNINAGQLSLINSVSGVFSYKIVEPTGATTYFVAQTTEIIDAQKSPTDFARVTIRLELLNRVVRA